MAIIGDISTGSADMVTTPVGRVPGAAVQATVLGNILSGRHLRLPSLWATVLGNVLLGLCFGTTFRTPRMVTGMLATAGWLASLTACALLAAHHDFIRVLSPSAISGRTNSTTTP